MAREKFGLKYTRHCCAARIHRQLTVRPLVTSSRDAKGGAAMRPRLKWRPKTTSASAGSPSRPTVAATVVDFFALPAPLKRMKT
jgi:hypothetical protein